MPCLASVRPTGSDRRPPLCVPIRPRRDGERGSSLDPVRIFLHIPKTAGTTFSAILDRNVPRQETIDVYPLYGITVDEFRNLPDSVRSSATCVKGHFDYGVHRELDRAFTYGTFLRRPEEQVRSRFNHAFSSRFHPLHRFARDVGTLAEFARKSPDNYQTRTLLGDETLPGQNFPALTDQDLDRVRGNIEQHFDVVGITERFDESLVVFKRWWNLDDVRYVRRNVWRRSGRETAPLDNETRRVLADHCRYDLVLYRWAEERLDLQIREEKASFSEEVEAFRRANRRYSRWMWLPERLAEQVRRGQALLRYLDGWR